MHVHCSLFMAQLIKASSLKKIRPITLIVRVEKNAKKISEITKIIFFVIDKYQSGTHVSTSILSTSILQGVFKNIVFTSVAVIKKLWAILDIFLYIPDFFPPCTLPYALQKNA